MSKEQYKIKKYEEVTTQANRMVNDYKRDIRVLTIIVVITALLGVYACIRGLSISTEFEALKRENEELAQLVENLKNGGNVK